MIWSLVYGEEYQGNINEITMGLLFLQLMNYTDRMETGFGNRQQGVMISVLGYVEEHYRDGELSELAGLLHCDFYWLPGRLKRLPAEIIRIWCRKSALIRQPIFWKTPICQ